MLLMGEYRSHFAGSHFSFSMDTLCFSQSFTWLHVLPPQMLNVSQVPSSPAVSLVYAVKNGSVFLNGTVASNLLCQLSAELVGYFLFYPPLIIAERKSQSSKR